MDNEVLNIVYVDGFKIRNTLDINFDVSASRSMSLTSYKPKWYIPENEIWIEDYCRDETDFLVKIEEHFVNVQRQDLKKQFCETGIAPEFRIRSKQNDGVSIVYVDGGIVRKYFDPLFCVGGHDLVYSYIPQNEIWIDKKNYEADQKYVLMHESHERKLMAEGKIYDVAHEYAIALELDARVTDGALYPGMANYPWKNLSNQEIIEKYVIERITK